jgi:hypothetical protein
MRIGIIGAGSVGGTLGRILASKGHSICFGVRNSQNEKVQSLLTTIPGEAQADSIEAAASFGEVIILATPWTATQEAITQAGNLAGKILIDCVNPIEMTPTGLAQGLLIGHHTSAAEEIAKWATGAKVVKAFNNIGASQFENLTFGSIQATAFICGDDEEAKKVVTSLAEDIGFEVVDVGELKGARLLEPLGMLWIHLAIFRGFGQKFAINLLKH